MTFNGVIALTSLNRGVMSPNSVALDGLRTGNSAIAERPRCSLFNLWQKYKCEKRASNIALCYGVDVDESSFYCSTAPCLYIMQN